MFEGFANVWTPLIEARTVSQRPMRLVLAGEPVVLFRGANDAIGALIDRCPHRGVALSLGQVGPDGCLECPFHGWRFATDGSNRKIPLNPEARLERLGAIALPVRVIGDLVWVYTGLNTEAAGEPVVPEGLSSPDLSRIYVSRDWTCHWTRAMENMLDSPHLPFVHRRTIGRTYRRRMTDTSRMDITWEDRPWGGRSQASLDGVGGGGHLEFFRPNVMALTIPIPKRRLQIFALVIPAKAGETRLIVAASRDFARARWLNPLFAWSNGRIADEDKAVVESSGSDETPALGIEPVVGTDRATLQFRKYYWETLRGSAA